MEQQTLSTQPQATGEWMTIEDLSKYLGQSKSNIYKLTCYRRIPFYRPGKKVLFKKSEIDSWIQSCRVNSTLETINPSLTINPNL